MPHRHDAGAKPKRQAKRKASKAQATLERRADDFYPHPVFGQIPRIDANVVQSDGSVYFYVDRPRTCVQCGYGFVFRAAEQKHWYESLKFHFDSVAVRCVDCRRKRRSGLSLQQELRDAKARVAQEPESAAAGQAPRWRARSSKASWRALTRESAALHC